MKYGRHIHLSICKQHLAYAWIHESPDTAPNSAAGPAFAECPVQARPALDAGATWMRKTQALPSGGALSTGRCRLGPCGVFKKVSIAELKSRCPQVPAPSEGSRGGCLLPPPASGSRCFLAHGCLHQVSASIFTWSSPQHFSSSWHTCLWI